jgi:putative transposase
MRRPQLVNDEIYHIVLRGASDSLIFLNKDDYYRGVFSLFEFNDEQMVSIRARRRARLNAKKLGNKEFSATRKILVEIFTFCFMPNHIHLLLRQIKDNGITDFMRKFGTGYALYFNKMHKRQGHLFQGKFKAVHIKNDSQLIAIFNYIHSNPVSLVEPNWKGKGARFPQKAIKFLNKYKWSSYQDYIGQTNFPSVTERNFLSEMMGGVVECKKSVQDWIKHKKEVLGIGDIALE